MQSFASGYPAALERLAAVRPAEYARSRNALDGAVTGLSPYFTHGVLALPEALSFLGQRYALDWPHKLVFEFAWREFFHHVWRHAGAGGDAILDDLRPSAVGAVRYASTLPADIREGRTGVPAIDTAVRVLYRSGYLHNHARMWLASYVVHLRKVHWRAGADWMFGHLLDGDLASNHLSWQWVAGTFSSKPYLFNAENVARYAPARSMAAWASPGTAIDRSYEALDDAARRGRDCGPERGVHDAVSEPELFDAPPPEVLQSPAGRSLPTADAARWAGRSVRIVHPWALAPRATDDNAELRLGLIHKPAHGPQPWSARRWQWVIDHLAASCDALWIGDAHRLDLSRAASVHATATRHPGYREWLVAHAQCTPPIEWLPDPPRPCGSFSRYYAEVQRQSGSLSDTLACTPWPLPNQLSL